MPLLFYLLYSKGVQVCSRGADCFAVFVRNLVIIQEHNARFAAGKTTFEMGISQFTDMVYLY